MFYHRVLPPPSNLTTPGKRSPSASNQVFCIPSSTDEDRMTAVAERSSISNLEHRILRTRQPRDQSTRQQYQQARDPETSSPIVLRSSARLSGKTQRSTSPASETRPVPDHIRQLSSEPEVIELGEASPAKVCICQPDPKVPRPRNAFILFRQHHQAAVVSQNPGLANPDISKIIGDAWRAASEETRDYWKVLAEEEKLRHQKQYPDYRYQPRRAGRNSLTNTVVTDPETQRCLKCGGRSMQMYSSLPAPGTPISPRTMQSNPPMGSNTILSRGVRYIGSPSHPLPPPPPPPHPPPPPVESRRLVSANGESGLSLRQRESIHQVGPDLKRRRYDGPAPPSPHPAPGGFPPSFSQSGRRPSMPHPAITTRGDSISVPRALPSGGLPARAPGPMLAPLQIDTIRDATSQGKAVEAMVMSIPALRKIKVLSQISPPLPLPGPATPPHKVRGALIAIEGSDEEAIKMTSNYLKDYLERDGDYKVRILKTPVDIMFENNASWLNTITRYHQDSQDIIKYITTAPQADDHSSPATTRRSSESSSMGLRKNSDQEDEPMVTTPSSPEPPTNGQDRFRRAGQAIPVMIVPKYQLFLTDSAASQIPIHDEYAPTDHWQWMATIWRGVVGPDVTVVVRTSPSHIGGANGMPGNQSSRTAPSPADTQGKSSLDSPMSSRDVNMAGSSNSGGGTVGGAVSQIGHTNPVNAPAVDIRLQEARAVFLYGKADGKLCEAGLRRVGFEIGEWARDIESREREREAREAVRSRERAV